MPVSGPRNRPPLNVFITTDTEVWPRLPDWRTTKLADDLKRDIYGETPAGEVGIRYQLDVMNAHGLRSVFFIEPLFASAVGVDPLRAIVTTVTAAGHDAQLHIHTEWLKWLQSPSESLPNIGDYPADQQLRHLQHAASNLAEAAGVPPRAFRAGNYGADFHTLSALAALNIPFDSSYNPLYLNKECRLDTGSLESQPRQLEGVWEYPISSFFERPGRLRHAQVCACSVREMETALERAWESGWDSFVIVSHSFELLKDRKPPKLQPRPDAILVKRFENLCRFLGQNNDRFVTRTFAELPVPAGDAPARPHINGKIWQTAGRYVEQGMKRWL